jgi:hypothetical protein
MKKDKKKVQMMDSSDVERTENASCELMRDDEHRKGDTVSSIRM